MVARSGVGSLKKTISPSPAKCSTVPPLATASAPTAAWYCRSTPSTSSGSAFSANAVKPRMSANRAVISLPVAGEQLLALGGRRAAPPAWAHTGPARPLRSMSERRQVDGDRGLIGELLDEPDLSFRERPDLVAGRGDHADELVVVLDRDAQVGPDSAGALGRSPGPCSLLSVLVGQDVLDVHDPLRRAAPGPRPTRDPGTYTKLRDELLELRREARERAHPVGLTVADGDVRGVGAAQLRGLLDHRLEDLVEVEVASRAMDASVRPERREGRRVAVRRVRRSVDRSRTGHAGSAQIWVRICGPSAVMAMVCSKWAARASSLRRDGPAVGLDVDVAAAEREHRLDREADARAELRAAATRCGSSGPAGPGASRCRSRGRRTAGRCRSRAGLADVLDRRRDVADACAGLRRADAGHHRQPRRVHELARLVGHLADHERAGAVAVPAVEDRADVDGHERAVADRPLARDAVDDLGVDRDAGARREGAALAVRPPPR